MVMSSLHSSTFYKWRWLFSHGAFMIGIMISSTVLFSAFILLLMLNYLEAVYLHLLPLWSADLHWVRIFPLMVAQAQNWRYIDARSSCETLLRAARLVEVGMNDMPLPPPRFWGPVTQSGSSFNCNEVCSYPLTFLCKDLQAEMLLLVHV